MGLSNHSKTILIHVAHRAESTSPDGCPDWTNSIFLPLWNQFAGKRAWGGRRNIHDLWRRAYHLALTTVRDGLVLTHLSNFKRCRQLSCQERAKKESGEVCLFTYVLKSLFFYHSLLSTVHVPQDFRRKRQLAKSSHQILIDLFLVPRERGISTPRYLSTGKFYEQGEFLSLPGTGLFDEKPPVKRPKEFLPCKSCEPPRELPRTWTNCAGNPLGSAVKKNGRGGIWQSGSSIEGCPELGLANDSGNCYQLSIIIQSADAVFFCPRLDTLFQWKTASPEWINIRQ